MIDVSLPSLVWLFDDDEERLRVLRIVWRRGAQIGGVIEDDVRGARARALRRSLRADYYAAAH